MMLVKLKSTKLTTILLIIAGMANTFSFAPYDYFYVSWLSLSVLITTISTIKPQRAWWYGFCYGLGWFGAGISWVHISIEQHGGMPLLASLSIMLILVCYLALYPALACYLTRKFCGKLAGIPLTFASFWLISEWLRSHILTGFPWLSLGYGQLHSPLAQVAPLIGEVGITYLVCLIAGALMLIIKRQHLPQSMIIIAGISIILPILPQKWTTPLNMQKDILLVQGNIEQSLRWQPENDWPQLLTYLDLSRPHYSQVDLIIWPEAAIPILEPLAQEELHNLNRVLAQNRSGLVTGILDYHTDTKIAYNSLITLGLRNPQDNKGQYYYLSQNRYNKHHLLPIGEFVPFESILRNLAPLFNLPMSSFTSGEKIQPNLRVNGINLAPAICYEIAFPRLLRQNIDNYTDLILTVSNDAWFGDSIGPHQHMQIAQMRALEFGRPVVRATNNGISAVTDHRGTIKAQIPQFKAQTLTVSVPLVTGITPYLHYGDQPLWGITLLILITLSVSNLISNRRNRLKALG